MTSNIAYRLEQICSSVVIYGKKNNNGGCKMRLETGWRAFGQSARKGLNLKKYCTYFLLKINVCPQLFLVSRYPCGLAQNIGIFYWDILDSEQFAGNSNLTIGVLTMCSYFFELCLRPANSKIEVKRSFLGQKGRC